MVTGAAAGGTAPVPRPPGRRARRGHGQARRVRATGDGGPAAADRQAGAPGTTQRRGTTPTVLRRQRRAAAAAPRERHVPPSRQRTIRYDARCCFNVRSKADVSQFNLPHGSVLSRRHHSLLIVLTLALGGGRNVRRILVRGSMPPCRLRRRKF